MYEFNPLKTPFGKLCCIVYYRETCPEEVLAAANSVQNEEMTNDVPSSPPSLPPYPESDSSQDEASVETEPYLEELKMCLEAIKQSVAYKALFPDQEETVGKAPASHVPESHYGISPPKDQLEAFSEICCELDELFARDSKALAYYFNQLKLFRCTNDECIDFLIDKTNN